MEQNSIFWVDVDKVQPNPYQPRREFDEVGLRSLADSIRQYGILQPLVVTTAHRGVFFGYGKESDSETIVLERARMCLYWPAETRGVLGLAVTGPAKGSKVGPSVPRITLRDVTAVMATTREAADRWERTSW